MLKNNTLANSRPEKVSFLIDQFLEVTKDMVFYVCVGLEMLNIFLNFKGILYKNIKVLTQG